MTKMVSMKMSKKETEKATEPIPSEGPEYPYGLCLNLEKEQIEKLGLGTPKAGSTLMLHAMVEVKSITVTDEKDGKGYKSLSLQITDMALEKGGGMNEKKVAGALYGKA
ncbi:MAG: bbp20 [Actinobacteria bacterium]|nr:bbp20 [Actinomycetota bacterium]